jgi:hypothetical protein
MPFWEIFENAIHSGAKDQVMPSAQPLHRTGLIALGYLMSIASIRVNIRWPVDMHPAKNAGAGDMAQQPAAGSCRRS